MAIKGTSPGTFPPGQCTRYADDRYHQITGWYVPFSGDAHSWRDNAPHFGWKVSGNPVVPSIICLQPGVQGASSFGHVGIVESITSKGVITSDLNWPEGSTRVNSITFQTGPGVSFIYATGSNGIPLGSTGKKPPPPNGSGTSGSNPIATTINYTYQVFDNAGNQIHDLLNNVPGFAGIFEALDKAEQFQAFQLPANDTSPNTSIGWIGYVPIVGQVAQAQADINAAKNLATLPANSIQATLVFITSNSLAFSLRAVLIMAGFILFMALAFNIMSQLGEQIMDNPIIHTAASAFAA